MLFYVHVSTVFQFIKFHHVITTITDTAQVQ